MQKPILYLAGPMSGLTWREATEWRDKVVSELDGWYDFITPCVNERIYDLDELISVQKRTDNTLPIYQTATGVTAQDEWFIDKSDWILANFTNAKKASLGTVWELGYAWGTNKKIFSVIDPNGLHDHPFIRRRSHVFSPTLDEAIEYFKAIRIT